MAVGKDNPVRFQGQIPTSKPAPAKPAPADAAPVTAPTRGALLAQREAPVVPKTFTTPGNGPSPNEPPQPALQQHGFNGGIQAFNQRVQAVVDNYQKSYGFPPPAGLVFDLAKSPVHQDDFAHMFTVPLSSLAAKNRGIAVQHGFDPHAPAVPTADDLAKGIIHAAFMGDYQGYVDRNQGLIHDLSRGDKADAAKITGAIFKARRFEAQKRVSQDVADGKITPTAATQQLRAEGFLPSNDLTPVHGALGIVAKGIGQVADSLVHSPAGLYQLGKSAGLDTNDAIAHNNFSFRRSRRIGEAMVKSTIQDVQHPGRNPGYLFLDVLGFASPLASGAARVGEAGRVLRAGEGVGSVAKALARKPALQRATLTYQGHTEAMPLIDNPLVAAAQKLGLKLRQSAAERDPTALTNVLHETKIGEALDRNFSFARKIGRLADARKRVDHIAATHLQRELDHVAGATARSNTLLSRVGDKFRRGLTRGENKAIQAQSWDVAGSPLDKIQAERDFHQRMIDMGVGDPKAHKRQIADLKLAEQALKNPSPRFLKALALSRRAADEMTAMKIQDLGLAPETAEGRVANVGHQLRNPEDLARINRAQAALTKLEGIARSQVAKTGEVDPGLAAQIDKYRAVVDETPNPLVGGRPVNPDSFYSPVEPIGKQKRQPSDRVGYYPTKPSPYGVTTGRDLPELKHRYTGEALESGDYRIDVPHLLSEAFGRTVRAVEVRSEHAKLWDEASLTKRGKWDVPIRDVNTIPQRLRALLAKLDEGYVTNAEAEALPANVRELIHELYPDEKALTDEEIAHVRWVDQRVLGDASSLPSTVSDLAKAGDFVNAPFRFTTLYARPAYILNKLGNEAMLVFDQGVFTSAKNMIRAMRAEKLYGTENANRIRALVGAGHSRSLVNSSVSHAGQAVAEFWNKVADRDERVASFLHYAERKGYRTREEMTRLLTSKDARADLREVTDRANKALVQFDNLTTFEKNVLRHWVFVYPWVSRSAVWSIRAILEHPTKTDLLSKLGEQDIQNDPLAGKVVQWVKDTGYVPIGFNHDGSARVVNPSSINTFSTIGNYLSLTRGLTHGDKYGSAEDFLGPFPRFLVHAITGRDQYGNQYSGSQIVGAAKEVLAGLPQVVAYNKTRQAAGETKKEANVASRSSLVASYKASLHKAVLTPGWLDGMGSLIAGGLSPRGLNLDAATARYWNDQNPAVRQKRELQLLNQALNAQGEVLGRKVPAAVRTAVSDLSQISYRLAQFHKQHGRTPNEAEHTKIAIDFLHQDGQITAEQAAKLTADLKKADPDTIPTLRNVMLDKYAGHSALREWDQDVSMVASFKAATFNRKAATLYDQGLADQKRYNVSQEKLYDYGRKYVAFVREAQRMKKAGASSAELNAFQDRHDKPVDGLPSFVRIAWANQTPADQKTHIDAITNQSWDSLSGFDKALLGRPSDATVTAGWVKLKQVVEEQRQKLARQGRSFPSGYERTLAKWVQRYYDTSTGQLSETPKAPPTGLLTDYDFSQKPLWERLKYLKPIQESPHHTQWIKLLNFAGKYSRYLHATDSTGQHLYDVTAARQYWKDYVASAAFQAWLGENPAFKAEVQDYGKGFLDSLIG